MPPSPGGGATECCGWRGLARVTVGRAERGGCRPLCRTPPLAGGGDGHAAIYERGRPVCGGVSQKDQSAPAGLRWGEERADKVIVVSSLLASPIA
jgi:hypothetical protein